MKTKQQVVDLLNSNNLIELIIDYTHEKEPKISSDELSKLVSLANGNPMLYSHAADVASKHFMDKHEIKSLRNKNNQHIKFY